MNLKQMEAYLRIANNNSFSKTAKEMYLTQPTVSAYISSLETELGVQLFARTTKAVELTEDGKKIYLYARELVELADKIQKTFSETPTDKPERQIVISASSIPAQYLLPQILAEYSRRFPQIRFRLVESDSAAAVADIAEHKADIGFVGTAFHKKFCAYTPFYRDELILVTQNSEKYHRLRESQPLLTWVRDASFILRENGSGTRREALKTLMESGIREEDLHVVANFSNTDAVLMSVKEGIGISVISRLAAQEKIDRGEILDFKLSEEGKFRSIYYVTSLTHPLSEPGQKLVDLIRTMYPEGENDRKEA